MSHHQLTPEEYAEINRLLDTLADRLNQWADRYWNRVGEEMRATDPSLRCACGQPAMGSNRRAGVWDHFCRVHTPSGWMGERSEGACQ
jgi:hypothetical protein